jgi:hypothetical protein
LPLPGDTISCICARELPAKAVSPLPPSPDLHRISTSSELKPQPPGDNFGPPIKRIVPSPKSLTELEPLIFTPNEAALILIRRREWFFNNSKLYVARLVADGDGELHIADP